MHVLMFGWEFPPHNSGGLGVACQGLVKALAASNVGLVFVLPRRFSETTTSANYRLIFADAPNVAIEEVDSYLLPYLTPSGYLNMREHCTFCQYGRDLFEEVDRYARAAGKIAQREAHDVIHAHDWLSFGAGIAAKKQSGRPLVAHVHATEIDRTAGHVNPYIFEREREGVAAADRVISVSSYTKDVLVSHYGVPSEKITVVHNGIDKGNYEIADDLDLGLAKFKKLGYKIVLFVGRITVMKGPDYFLKAAQIVLKHNPKVLFVVAGSGDMELATMQQAAELKISDKVIFTGFLRGRPLSQVFKAANLFVMPSVSEPFGLTPLESLLHGTPVLISRQSGVSEVMSHALKANFWDVEDIADKILSIVKYPSLEKTLSQNGNLEAEGCTWDKAASKCLGVYNQLII